MKHQFPINALPILVSIQAAERIEKVSLSANPGGLACEISPTATKALTKEILQFFEGYLYGETLSPPPLEWRGNTPFTHSVLQKLITVPFGTTLTYAQIAHAVGSPQGARAVGGACGRNPFPFFLPCHRVVASGGLGGFSAGLELKKLLLDFEITQNHI